MDVDEDEAYIEEDDGALAAADDLLVVAALLNESDMPSAGAAALTPDFLATSNAALGSISAELSLAGIERSAPAPALECGAASDSGTSSDESDEPVATGAGVAAAGGAGEGGGDDDAVSSDADEGGGAPAVLRTVHEVPLSRLPVPDLPSLRVEPAAAAAPAGAVISVHRGASWDDPFAEMSVRRRGRRARGDSDHTATGAAGAAADANFDTVLTLVVQGHPHSRALAEGSLLVLGDGRSVGVVEDVFGPVAAPCYVLRAYVCSSDSARAAAAESSAAPSALQALVSDYDEKAPASAAPPRTLVGEAEIVIGTVLYTANAFSNYVLADALRAASGRGTDASNVFDEELPPEEQEFSDDEAETAARAARKSRDLQAAAQAAGVEVAGARARRSGPRARPTHASSAQPPQQQNFYAGAQPFPAAAAPPPGGAAAWGAPPPWGGAPGWGAPPVWPAPPPPWVMHGGGGAQSSHALAALHAQMHMHAQAWANAQAAQAQAAPSGPR